MHILLTGKCGQLGRCFQDVLTGANHTLFAYDSTELNIVAAHQVTKVAQQVKPNIIYTTVDKAESDVTNAYLVNATRTELLAKQASDLGIPFVDVSTDYVFDGEAVEPYLSSDQINPKGFSVASKLAGECAVLVVCNKYIIVRTAWVFSEYGHNFVKTMVRLAKECDALSVVADQYRCPTYVGNLAKAIFAKAEVLGVIDKHPQFTAISSDQYPTSVKRPAYSVMSRRALNELH